MNPENLSPSHYPAGLERREIQCLKMRRAKRAVEHAAAMADNDTGNIENSPVNAEERPANVVGLALSGGGQRSATFCLGVLQALAKAKLLHKIDYVSGVSGGNYMCSFLGGWVSRDGQSIENVEKELEKLHSPQVDFLRENGRFLAPNGAGDAWGAAVTHLRNWLSMLAVIGTLVLGVFLLGEMVKSLLLLLDPYWLPNVSTWSYSTVDPADGSAAEREYVYLVWSPIWKVALGVALLGALPVALAYWLVFPVKGRPPLAYYVPPVALLYLAIGLFMGKGVPEFIAQKPWPWIAVLLLTVEWGVWAELRQRLQLPPGTRHNSIGRITYWLLGIAVLVVLVTWWGRPTKLPPIMMEEPGRWIGLLGLVAVVHVMMLLSSKPPAQPKWYHALARHAARGFPGAGKVDEADFASTRSGMTSWLALIAGIAALVALFATVDSLAQTMAEWPSQMAKWSVSVISPVAVVALLRSQLPKLLADDEAGGETSSIWLSIALWVGAGLVTLNLLTAIGLAANLWARHLTANPAPLQAWMPIAFAAIGVLVLSFVLGRRLEFVNLSSHHALYSSRLTRAYLGASNEQRRTLKNWQVTETVTDDQIEFGDYRPHENGGPLHLINVTVNETISGISNIEERDRKGFSLAVGPAGISVRSKDHAVYFGPDAFAAPRRVVLQPVDLKANDDARFHVFGQRSSEKQTAPGTEGGTESTPEVSPAPTVTAEMPAIGAWMGTSGAAFTTGLGARTSIATSLLLGLFNIRLGYWWDSGVVPHNRPGVARRTKAQSLGFRVASLFPAQVAFVDEMLARFHGPSRKQWYLSDGGHFENTACYELIRRQVPFIICCDCGCDPETTFEDVANLVRKARIDFGAEIDFIEAAGLAKLEDKARQVIGPLSALRAKPDDAEGQRLSSAHAALAQVTYTDTGKKGWLLLIKPTLSALLSRDVLHYAADNPPFPQQTTMDQFFDEAQWESYRRLGFEIGNALFEVPEVQPRKDEDGWQPDFSKVVVNAPPPKTPLAAINGEDILKMLSRYIREEHSRT
jgi:hypothetical protein